MNENMSENTRALGFLPPLGWNSWNTFTWDINESLNCRLHGKRRL